MENAYYMCISEWMTISFRIRGVDHNTRVQPRFYGVCIASNVVSCVVNTQHVTSIDALPRYEHSASLFVSEVSIGIPCTVSFKQVTKYVVL